MPYKYLMVPGHGGMIDGVYQTNGKRKQWPDGTVLYEGEFNRDIVERIMRWGPRFGLDCVNLVPEQEDISLSERVRRAIKYHQRGEKCILISVHANAGGGRGIEVFTSPGQTLSDKVATVFYEKFMEVFPDVHQRTDFTDGDPDKEAEFTVLTKTPMPAILTENFFMDNERECREILLTEEGRADIAQVHLAAMLKIDKEGL